MSTPIDSPGRLGQASERTTEASDAAAPGKLGPDVT